MNVLVIVWLIYFHVLFCVCRSMLFLNVNWAFVVITIGTFGRQICTVNQLNKQFNSSHIIATGLSLQSAELNWQTATVYVKCQM